MHFGVTGCNSILHNSLLNYCFKVIFYTSCACVILDGGLGTRLQTSLAVRFVLARIPRMIPCAPIKRFTIKLKTRVIGSEGTISVSPSQCYSCLRLKNRLSSSRE